MRSLIPTVAPEESSAVIDVVADPTFDPKTTNNHQHQRIAGTAVETSAVLYPTFLRKESLGM